MKQHQAIRWALVFVLLSCIYSLTAHWSLADQNVDTIATTLPGWHLATGGTFDLSAYADLNPWIVETPGGYWTNRPPGMVLVGYVAHLLAAPFTDGYGGGPGTLVAVLLAAGAVTIIGVEIARLYGSRTGYLSAVALGLASATWPSASTELFPHAVGQFLMALTIRYLAQDRLWMVGGVLGVAVTVRPPLAIVALILGIALAVQRRSAQPAIAVGIPSSIGLAALLVYNRAVFGVLTVSGGYGDFYESGSNYRTPAGYLRNLFGTFFDGSSGVFVWSSWILVVLIYLAVRKPKTDNSWAFPAALAAVAYLLVHTALNRYWGGLAFNYRYALEPLVLAMPMLALGLSTILSSKAWRMAFITSLGVSILFQAAVAFLLTCVSEGDVASCTIL